MTNKTSLAKQNLVAAALLGLLAQPLWAASVTFKKDGEIKSEPTNTGAVIATLKTAAQAEMLERKGFWVEVKSGSVKGWTKLSNVEVKGEESGASGGASLLTGLASGRAGTGNIVNTSGTRGLDGDQLKSSQRDDAQLKMLSAKHVKPEEASGFAKDAGLKSRTVAYLKPPAAATASKP